MISASNTPLVGHTGFIQRHSKASFGDRSKTFGQILKALFSNSEQGFAYDINDLSTLYQDAAGTTPVTAAGQPVGLVLDKSRSDGRGIVNKCRWSDDITKSEWSAISATKLTANSFQFPAIGAMIEQLTVFGSTSGKTITVSCRMWVTSGTNTVKLKNTHGGVIDNFSADITLTTVPTRYSFSVTNSASGGAHQIIGVSATGATLLNSPIFADSFQIEEGSLSAYQANAGSVGGMGNHAYQTTSASRPLLQQTPILGSELIVNGDFTLNSDNWVATNSSALSVVNGALKVLNTANRLDEQAEQSIFSKVTKGRTYSYSVTIKETVGTSRLMIETSSVTVINRALPVAGTYTGSFTVPNDATALYVRLRAPTIAGNYGIFDDVSVKGITGYRTDQNYLLFDGTDDFLVTNSIDFTATDKVSLFAGVRVLSNAVGVVVEHGASTATTDRSFNFYTDTQFHYALRVTSAQEVANSPVKTTHVSGVVTSFYNTNGVSNVERIKPRFNAVPDQFSWIGSTVAGGNFSSNPIYIGRRAGSSYPFNGHLYSLVGVARLSTDAETTALEKAIAKNVGVTLSV